MSEAASVTARTTVAASVTTESATIIIGAIIVARSATAVHPAVAAVTIDGPVAQLTTHTTAVSVTR